MEPIAALSLATNIIQIVNYSSRIISKSSELYHSTNGRLNKHTDIATASTDLNQLTAKLSESIRPQSIPTVLPEDELALYDICSACTEISDELQIALNTLELSGTPSRLKSVRKALKSIWSKEHICELQSRLEIVREQLDSRILVGLKSSLDIVALQQSEGFNELDDGVKNLVVSIQEANESNLTAISVAHTGIDASIASSSAVATEEHERMKTELTQQWKSAEVQIAQLRDEIRDLETRIADHIQRAVANGASPQEPRQRKLNEDTNLLYKVWAAKDLMLQKLLELVDKIKALLLNVKASVVAVTWRLGPYERLDNAIDETNRSSIELSTVVDTVETVETLFMTIEHGNIDDLNNFDDIRPIVNKTKRIQIQRGSLDPQIATFYETLCPSTLQDTSWSLCFKITPLTWAVFALRNDTRQTRLAILNLLLRAGADRRRQDETGMCAYEHARLLKLDDETINRLNPYATADNAEYGLTDAILASDSTKITECLINCSLESSNYGSLVVSPIALAIAHQLWTHVPHMLRLDLSPFAAYRGKGIYHPPLAYYVLHERGSQKYHSLSVYFWDWVDCHLENPSKNCVDLLSQALTAVFTAPLRPQRFEPSIQSETIVFSVLLGKHDYVRTLLRDYSPDAHLGDYDSVVWALYAAIRRGDLKPVQMLVRHCGSKIISPLGKLHFLSSWWPWECRCQPDVHSVVSRSLLHYVELLPGSRRLCTSCGQHRTSYREINRCVQAAARSLRLKSSVTDDGDI